MYEFEPSEQRTAVVTFTNPTSKAFPYSAKLFIGLPEVVSSTVEFLLEAGESKIVNIPIIMPSTPGIYPVYISIHSGQEFVVLYRAADDIAITAVAEFQLTDLTVQPIEVYVGEHVNIGVTVQNIGIVEGSVTIGDEPDCDFVLDITPSTYTPTVYAPTEIMPIMDYVGQIVPVVVMMMFMSVVVKIIK